jgi:hypothetical protein
VPKPREENTPLQAACSNGIDLSQVEVVDAEMLAPDDEPTGLNANPGTRTRRKKAPDRKLQQPEEVQKGWTQMMQCRQAMLPPPPDEESMMDDAGRGPN